VKILFSPKLLSLQYYGVNRKFCKGHKFFNDCHYKCHPTFVDISFWQCGLYLISTTNLWHRSNTNYNLVCTVIHSFNTSKFARTQGLATINFTLPKPYTCNCCNWTHLQFVIWSHRHYSYDHIFPCLPLNLYVLWHICIMDETWFMAGESVCWNGFEIIWINRAWYL
jgi:hypothetical protein